MTWVDGGPADPAPGHTYVVEDLSTHERHVGKVHEFVWDPDTFSEQVTFADGRTITFPNGTDFMEVAAEPTEHPA